MRNWESIVQKEQHVKQAKSLKKAGIKKYPLISYDIKD